MLNRSNNDWQSKIARKTVDLNTEAPFMKIIVENFDKTQTVSNVKVIADLKG